MQVSITLSEGEMKELPTNKPETSLKESTIMSIFKKARTLNGFTRKRDNSKLLCNKPLKKPKLIRRDLSMKAKQNIKKVFVNFLDIMKK